MDGGAWWATVHGVSKSRTRLRNFTLSSKEAFAALPSFVSLHLNHFYSYLVFIIKVTSFLKGFLTKYLL